MGELLECSPLGCPALRLGGDAAIRVVSLDQPGDVFLELGHMRVGSSRLLAVRLA